VRGMEAEMCDVHIRITSHGSTSLRLGPVNCSIDGYLYKLVEFDSMYDHLVGDILAKLDCLILFISGHETKAPDSTDQVPNCFTSAGSDTDSLGLDTDV
jgi:hypothetical protein